METKVSYGQYCNHCINRYCKVWEQSTHQSLLSHVSLMGSHFKVSWGWLNLIDNYRIIVHYNTVTITSMYAHSTITKWYHRDSLLCNDTKGGAHAPVCEWGDVAAAQSELRMFQSHRSSSAIIYITLPWIKTVVQHCALLEEDHQSQNTTWHQQEEVEGKKQSGYIYKTNGESEIWEACGFI